MKCFLLLVLLVFTGGPSAATAGPGVERALTDVLSTSVADLLAMQRMPLLSAAQRQQVADVLTLYRNDILLQAQERAEADRALRGAILDRRGDQAVKHAARRAADSLVNEAVLRSRIVAEVMPLLTEPQRTAWRELVEKAEQRADDRFATQL